MKNENLLRRLSKLGFPLFEPEEVQDANATLADVVRSKDLRLWEGFPVVLASSAEKELFNYDMTKEYLKEPFEKLYLDSLVVVALALYEALNLKFSWAEGLYKSLSPNQKKEFGTCFEKLKKNENLEVAGQVISSQRLKSVFNNYFAQAQSKLSDLLSVKEEHSLEYSLSQVFSPKQKELFLKKLRREKLSKTEKEYFSRVVKKKVLALANSELHRLSRKLLE